MLTGLYKNWMGASNREPEAKARNKIKWLLSIKKYQGVSQLESIKGSASLSIKGSASLILKVRQLLERFITQIFAANHNLNLNPTSQVYPDAVKTISPC